MPWRTQGLVMRTWWSLMGAVPGASAGTGLPAAPPAAPSTAETAEGVDPSVDRRWRRRVSFNFGPKNHWIEVENATELEVDHDMHQDLTCRHTFKMARRGSLNASGQDHLASIRSEWSQELDILSARTSSTGTVQLQLVINTIVAGAEDTSCQGHLSSCVIDTGKGAGKGASASGAV